MAKKLFPQFKDNISMALTPMVLTARLIKKDNPDCPGGLYRPLRGQEAGGLPPHHPRSDVDFVLTFEEMQGVFDARGVDPSKMPGDPEDDFMKRHRRRPGLRRYRGGVAAAVKEAIARMDPEREECRWSTPTACGSAGRCC